MPTTRSVAVDRLTTTEAAVLALLAMEGERSAYDLTKLVAQAIATSGRLRAAASTRSCPDS